MAMPATIVRTAAFDRRDTPRRQLELQATLRDAASTPLDARLHDLSTGGVLLEAAADFQVGDEIGIGIGGLGVCPARVIRVAGRLYGCSFVAPISRMDVARARASEVHRLRNLADLRPEPYPEPAIRRWPVQARLAFILVAAAATWGTILVAATATVL